MTANPDRWFDLFPMTATPPNRWLGRPEPTERTAPLPGDWLVPHPTRESTRAITIAAAAGEVWPWIVQIGQDRGGFYSYCWLENLLGCRMQNADRIHAEWQNLVVGDRIAIHPRAQPLLVKACQPGSHLVVFQAAPIRWSWCFALFPVAGRDGAAATRLVVRTRCAAQGWFSRVAVGAIMGVGHPIMESRMMTGICQRAERKTFKPVDSGPIPTRRWVEPDQEPT